MDARPLRVARSFVVFLLIAQLSVGQAIGETASTTTPIARALKAGTPLAGGSARVGGTRPIPRTPVTGPLPSRGSTTTTPTTPSIAPRKRPNAQGPTTYAGTASLNFSPPAVYGGYSTTASGTINPAAGYTYQIDFGDATALVPIAIGANATSVPYGIAHTYAVGAEGTETATIKATDANGNTTTIVSQAIVVDAISGTVSNVSANTNTPVTITFNGSMPAMNPPPAPAITIDYGDGSPTTASTFAASVSVQHTYTTTGTYTITVSATASGATIATGTATINIARINTDNGTIVASPAYVYLGSPITFSGNAPTNPANATQDVTYGDGQQSAAFPDGGTYSFAHTYANAGNYTASVVQPNAATGQSATLESTAVTVDALSGNLSAPTVATGSASAITFFGNVPATNAPAPPAITIAYGDGQTATSTYGATVNFTHTYTAPGTYTVTVTGNGMTLATGSATVSATTDTLSANPAAIYSGSSDQITLTPANAAASSRKSCVIEFGDGTTQALVPCGAQTVTHTYTATTPTTENIRLSPQQNAGTTDATTSLTVDPLGGTIAAATVMQGSASSVTFTGMVPASNPPAPPMVTIGFGDGQTTMVTYGTVTSQHTYAAPGTYALTATVNGNTIATGSAVVNAPALMVTAAPGSIYSGASTTFTISDPAASPAAPATCTIVFGDGATQNFTCGSYTVAHTYTVTSNTPEAVSVFVVGPNGGPLGNTATTTVDVVVPAATVSLSAATLFAGATENATIMTDAISGATGPSMTIDWGDGSAPTTGLAFENQVVSHGYATTRSGGTNHRYVAPGAYTIRLYDAAGTLATQTVTVVTPSATLTAANPTLLTGQPESFALAVGGVDGLQGPMLSVSYGDGSSSVVTYANTTLSHAYMQAGTYTATVTDGTQTLATTTVVIGQPTASIAIVPDPVILGSTANITVSLSSLGGLTGPAPLVLNFGDGTTTTLPSYTGASYQHTYAAVGTYSVTLNAPGFGTIGSNIVQVVKQNQALLVPLTPVPANAPADIVVNITPAMGLGVSPLRLAFGDGTSLIVNSSGTYPHAYPGPGIYTVTLSNLFNNLPISTQQLVVDGVTPRVPVGTIYSSSFTNSPVLAGGETNILIQYSLALPSMGTVFDPIEGYVDLLDAKGKLVRRSDDFEIEANDYGGPGVHTTTIPYDTPVDAHGTYQTRVILRSAQGGTISVGPPATLIIIGGPDPSIKLNAQFHDTGAVEVGPHAGEPGATFDAGISAGFLLPTYSGAISGLFDPISRKSDPLLTIKSGASPISAPDAAPAPTPAPAPSAAPATPAPSAVPAPTASAAATPLSGSPPGQNYAPAPTAVPSPVTTGSPSATTVAQQAFAVPDRAAAYATPSVPVAGPVAATAPPQPVSSSNPVPHDFTELGGRGQLTLPDALGGGSPLRGVDVLDTLGPVAYQVGYGYSSLGTADTSPERAAVGDLTRTFDGDGSVRVAYFGRQDDPEHYPIMSGATGPLVTDSEALIFSAPTIDGFKLAMSGAVSDAHALQSNYQTNDAADKLDLTYAHASYNFAFDYHNAGSLFAVGSGPGASSDRVGFASSSTIPLGSAVQVALNYNKDEARSAFSRQSDAGAAFSFTLPKSSTLALAYKRDTQVAPTANTLNNSETAAIGTHLGIGTIALNASVSDAQDLINAVNSAVTRTASFQYALQANGHAFGFGINATNVTAPGAMAPAVMATATPDPTIGDPTSMSAPAGVASSMVAPATGAGGNSQIGETITYGFPFGGRVVNGAIVRGLELQLSGSNSAQHALSAGGYDEMLSGILSYHLTPHLALGLRTEYDWHGDIVPENRHKASAIRLRLDLTQ